MLSHELLKTLSTVSSRLFDTLILNVVSRKTYQTIILSIYFEIHEFVNCILLKLCEAILRIMETRETMTMAIKITMTARKKTLSCMV